jgi:glycogen synthase
VRILRLCSVFEARSALGGRAARLDPVGGMQYHTAELTRRLDRRGVVQHVVTATRLGAPRRERVGERSDVRRVGVPIRRLRQLYAPPAALHALRLAPHVDLVHGHLGEDVAVLPIALLAARRAGAPLVVTVHESPWHTVRGGGPRDRVIHHLGGRVERVAEARAAAVIVLTERMAEHVVTSGAPRERVHVIPPGIDRALFGRTHADPLPGVPRPRVLYVGRLARSKGIDALVAAAGRLARRDAHVVLVGDGPGRRRLARLIPRHGLAGRVHVEGFVAHDDVPAYLEHADVLVLPSVFEELGTVLIEAQASGLPAVATDVGGIPEIVQHGATGLLVPPHRTDRLAHAIDRILGERDLAARMAATARERARRYDWDAVADRVLALYRDAAAGPSASG